MMWRIARAGCSGILRHCHTLISIDLVSIVLESSFVTVQQGKKDDALLVL